MVVISLLSDFGSMYPAQMKAVILGINPDAVLVDITHHIPPQDIRAGAFALLSSVPYFPSGTIHLSVVDPGVGTSRRPIVVRAGNQMFVGPDNGLLIPAARGLADNLEIREITNTSLFLPVTPTFHGRDIFAPVAAHLSQGMALSKVGVTISDPVEMDFGSPFTKNDTLFGEIIAMDDFGNLITNIPGGWMQGMFVPGDLLAVAGRQMPLSRTYADVEVGEPLVLIGSHGYVEIAVRTGSAARLLEIGLQIDIHKVM